MVARALPWLVLVLLPVLVHLPELAGLVVTDPLPLLSGLGRLASPAAAPVWIDPNAGYLTQAIGGLAARDWLAGVVPWWNPYTGVGMPLAGQAAASALFLPFVLLLALPQGVLLLKIAMQMLAGLATYALLRQMRACRAASLAAGLLFGLGGTFAWFAHAPILPIAFLPVLLLGTERAAAAAAARRPGGWACVAIGIGWSLLAGFPETAYLDGLLALAWALLRLAQAYRAQAYRAQAYRAQAYGAGGGAALRLAAKLAAGGLCGLLLAAPQTVPLLHLLPLAGQGVHALVAHLAVRPFVYPLYLVPYLEGPIGGYGPGSSGSGDWGYVGGYVGLPYVLLAILALLGPERGRERALRWLLAAWLALTLARAAGAPVLTDAANLVPLLARIMVMRLVQPSWQMACAVLAGLALDGWMRGPPNWAPNWAPIGGGRRWARPAAALALAALLLATSMLAARPALRGVLHHPGGHTWMEASLGWAAALAAALTALLARPPTPKRRALLLAALALDAAAMAMAPLAVAGRGASLDREPIGFLRAHLGLQRFVTLGPFAPDFPARFGLASVNYNVILNPLSWVAHVRGALDPAADDVQFPGPADSIADRAAALRANLPAYRALGVRYVLAFPGTGAVPGALVRHTPTTDIFDLGAAAPYWQADGCALLAAGRDAVSARCPRAATLVRRELFFPGWRATAAGAPLAITPAPPLFQAVALPPGETTVRFAYAPPGAFWAWAACAAGAAWLAAGLAFSRAASCRGSARRAGPAPP